MGKKLLIIFLIAILLGGVFFSISNFTYKPARALMVEEQLYYWDFGFAILYRCSGPGQGCYTVYPDK